jgi:hypothetical protein
MLQKLDLFPSLDEGRKTPNLLGPSESFQNIVFSSF